MKRILLLASLAILVVPCRVRAQQDAAAPASRQAQRYLVDRWTVDDGLPNNSLSGLLSSRDGYLWIGSLAGVTRFDGVRFTPIPVALPSSHVRALFEDSRGNLWFAIVGSGVVRAKDGRIEIFSRPQLAGSDARIIVEDAAGRIWVGTDDGVSVIAADGVTNLRRAQGLAGNSISSLVRGRDNAMWIATDGGVCKAVDLAVHCPPAGERVPGRQLAGMVQESVVEEGSLIRDRAGRLWIGGSGGLFSMREDFSATGPCAQGCFVGRPVTSIFESREGPIFAGFAGGGVGIVDNDVLEHYGTADGMAAGPVVAMTQDAEGSVWVSIYNGGLERLRRKRLRMYSTEDGLPAKVIGSVVQDVNGVIWAGSQCGPVAELRGDRFIPRFVEHTKGLCALVLLASRDGSLWIGTDGGLFHWANGRMRHFDRTSGLSDLRIRALFEDRDGVIWIGTLFGDLHTYANGAISRGYGPADGVVQHQLASFAQDPDGRVWIGSNGNGLSVYEHGRFRILPPGEQPPDRDITGMRVDSRGDLWVSTTGAGMFRRRSGVPDARFEPFGPEQGVGDSLVSLMLEDRGGDMWVSTTRGILRVERKAIDEVAVGRRRSLDPILIDRLDGMLNPEVSGGGFDPTGLVDRDGRLWFSTIDGIVVIEPSRFSINTVAPPVVIEALIIGDGAPQRIAGVAKVPAGGPPLELAYTGLSFLAPKKMRFRYRLAGFDREWTEAGPRRTAYYPHLPPGSYVFEVLAANSDGVWSAAPATLPIEVAPFWWERRSVQAAALFIVLVSTAVVARSLTLRRAARRLQELEREHQLDRERRRIAQDLHDDIGARLTRLALMAERTSNGATDVAAAARDTIQAMDELVWTVNASNDTLESMVSFCAAYADDYLRATNIRVRLQAPHTVPAVVVDAEKRRHVLLCLKEILNNVVKHSRASEVQMRIEATAEELRLEVRDNGTGFDPGTVAPTGNGLRGLRARARAAHGDCTISTAPGGGTTVHVHVPLSRS